jgi:hypothetical protein
MVLGEEVARGASRSSTLTSTTSIHRRSRCAPTRARCDQIEALARPIARVEAQSRPIWERWLLGTEGVRASSRRGIVAFPRIEGVADTRALSEFLVASTRSTSCRASSSASPDHVPPAARCRRALAGGPRAPGGEDPRLPSRPAAAARVRLALPPRELDWSPPMRQFLRSKIHKARVTGADVNYIGSVTLDQELMERPGSPSGRRS